MSISAVDNSNINYAFNRLVTFSGLNKERDENEKVEALYLYCNSVGLNDQSVNYIYDLCEQAFTDGEDVPSCAFIGILIGLAISEDIDNNKE